MKFSQIIAAAIASASVAAADNPDIVGAVGADPDIHNHILKNLLFPTRAATDIRKAYPDWNAIVTTFDRTIVGHDVSASIFSRSNTIANITQVNKVYTQVYSYNNILYTLLVFPEAADVQITLQDAGLCAQNCALGFGWDLFPHCQVNNNVISC